MVLTVALAAAVLVTQRQVPREDLLKHSAIEIQLAPTPTPPAPREVVPPDPPRAKPVVRKKVVPREPLAPATPLMTEAVETPTENVVAAPADAADPAPPIPAVKPSGTLEAQYAATLRSNIDARTVVPDSVEYRLRHPRGETRVDFTLDRGGSVLTTAVAHGSGSELLDRQAVRIVKQGRYPPFPEDAFRGESRHSFTVTLEFNT